jgi:hypothetical protein
MVVAVLAAWSLVVVMTSAAYALDEHEDDESFDYDEDLEEPGGPWGSVEPEPEPDDGDPTADPATNSVSPSGQPQGPVCTWITVHPDNGLLADQIAAELQASGSTLGSRPSEDYLLEVQHCPDEASDGLYTDGRWIDPDADPAADDGVDVEQLREDLYARVAGNLPMPEISSNPELGQPWYVNAPMFVSIDNWEEDESWDGSFTDQECDPNDPNFCAYVEAHPAMVFDPGDGTGDLGCEAPGEPFQPDIWADPFEQHDWDSTCSHIFELRSGVDDRPEEWPGEVCIVWTIDWWDDDGGEGTYEDPARNCAELPREVNGVNAIVTD